MLRMQSQTKAYIFVLCLAVSQTQVNANVRRECRKLTGVSWASLRMLKNGDLNQVDPELKCYVKCFMVKNGIISENNEVEIENTLRHLPRKLQAGSREILERCKTMRGNDSCDTAFQIVKCYFVAYPEVLQRVALV